MKVMELETQVQVSGNQLRRQDQDIKQLRDDLEVAATREKEAAAKLREQQHRYTDLESKVCHLKPLLSFLSLVQLVFDSLKDHSIFIKKLSLYYLPLSLSSRLANSTLPQVVSQALLRIVAQSGDVRLYELEFH